MKILNIFNKKDKIIDNELENIKMIPVPDIRAYMLKGYEEIRAVKNENTNLKEQLSKYQKKSEENEKLYDAALVTSEEFEKRCGELEKEVKRYKELYEREEIIRNADNKESTRKQEKLKEQLYITEQKIKIIRMEAFQEVKRRIVNCIKQQKGNLSKEKVINLVEKVSD